MSKTFVLQIEIPDDAFPRFDSQARIKFKKFYEEAENLAREFQLPEYGYVSVEMNEYDGEDPLTRIRRWLGESMPATVEEFEKRHQPQCNDDYRDWYLLEEIREMVARKDAPA